MARPKCMVDVWDIAYQELLVLAHAQDNQVKKQNDCGDKFITGKDILNNNKNKFLIKE